MNSKIGEFYQRSRTIILIIFIPILGYLVQLFFNLELSYHVKPWLFGDFNFSIQVLGILTTVVLLGTNVSSNRFLSSYIQNHEGRNVLEYIRWNCEFVRYTIFICLVIGVESYGVMQTLDIWSIKDIRNYHLMIYILWVTPLSALLLLFNNFLLAANHPIIYTLFKNITYLSYLFVLMMIVYVFQITFLRSFTLLLLILFSTILLFILNLWVIQRNIPFLFASILTAFNTPPRREEPEWRNISLRFAMRSIIIICNSNLDLVIVRILTSKNQNVGYYAAMVILGTVLLVIPQNIYAYIISKINAWASTSLGRTQLECRLKPINRITLIITLILCAILFLKAKILLGYFGEEYAQHYQLFYIMVCGFVFKGLSYPARTILTYAGYETALLKMLFAEFVLLIVLGGGLTYQFDLLGIAITTVIIGFLRNICYHVYTYKRAHIRSFNL